MSMNAAQKKYSRANTLLLVAYAATLFGVRSLIGAEPAPGALAYVGAVLPAIPVIGMIVAARRYLEEEPDEYLRAQATRRALNATGVTLAIATAWGFLESFGLMAHIDAYWYPVIWFATMGVGNCIQILKAGKGDE